LDPVKPALRSRPAGAAPERAPQPADRRSRKPLWKQIEQGAGRGRRRFQVASELRDRFGVTYDLDGPRVRLGLLWFVVLGAATFGGRLPVTVVLAVVCGFAAHQIATAWLVRDVEPDPLVSAAFGGGLVVAGAFDLRWVGLALILLVAAALGAAHLNARGGPTVVRDASQTVLAAAVVGLAGATAVACLRYDDRGALAVLLAFALAYDLGDFLIGSGSSNPLEGPIAGWMAIAAAATVVATLNVPPFRGEPAWAFAALAMVACPLGQLAASAILPSSRAPAPALRRLDSLLVLAPTWAFAVGLFIQHHR